VVAEGARDLVADHVAQHAAEDRGHHAHQHRHDGRHLHRQRHLRAAGGKQAQAQRVGPLHRPFGGLEVARAQEQHRAHAQASRAHSQLACCTQKKGRRSSSTSRSVPPPKAVSPATTTTPTASSRLRAASIRPDSAKARMATASMATWACVSAQGAVPDIATYSPRTGSTKRGSSCSAQ
jgi:hypothetical protein